MDSPQLNRRQFLTYLSASTASLLVHPKQAIAFPSENQDYSGPNVILIRFGGGVRRRETIDPDYTYAPYLRHILASRGILFSNMMLDQLRHVTTSHGEGTLYLLTGKYDGFSKKPGLRNRFEPQVPTLFEYLRKTFAIPDHQTLLINGENRATEEFFSFSNHHMFGANYRCQVLSLYRFKVFLLRQQLNQGDLTGQEQKEAVQALQELETLDYRNQGQFPYSPKLTEFWQEWQNYYGTTGLVNPRGDRLLTELAIWAIKRLQPKLLMINYNDPDYVHWGFPSHYTNGIAVIDRGIQRIVEAVDSDDYYRNNTVFCIVPDCGRDSNPFLSVPYQHHFNSRSAHEIFALFFGKGIQSGQVVDRPVSQIDVTPTLAQIMGFKADYAEGSVLEEIFT
ncbi:alkaline phosphatase family protein [Acaryochloris marina]|uniref:Conserved domain protein n=1 Tax=Acaryochloris marina (strain MBIC 11017) TaxID=329726 RepID=A8ZMR1_ACAM1|nr:sulfatase-like hydrolase/transferase [Acaryochloris marina]ABW32472.1 conserved domain protein [Acaryochloris marina MBIC11017]